MDARGADKRRLIADGVGRMMDWNRNLYPFPRKCFCKMTDGPGTSYQQLVEEEEDYRKLERAELYFYANIKDNIYRKVTVERNLVVADLCQILVAKFGYRRGVDYAIYEYWVDLGVERVVEDHEDILKAYIDQKLFNPNANFKFIFTRDTQRYTMYQHPELWNRSFLQNPVLIESDDDNTAPRAYPVELIQDREEFYPIVATRIYHHQKGDKSWPEDGWVLLRQGVVYAVADHGTLQDLATVSMADFRRKVGEHVRSGRGAVAAVARALDHHAYQTAAGGRRGGGGGDDEGHAVVLRPDRAPPGARRARTGAAPEPPASAAAPPPPPPDGEVRRVGCADARHRLSWVAAMRLAKYGKQLRENYKAFRSKKDQEPPTSPADDFISYAVSHVNNDSVRSRVAMDFTGARGRIVSDPAEAAAVAAGGGAPDAPVDWRRRWRAAGARRAALLRAAEASAGGAGAAAAAAHALQPWFHGGVTRERAGQLVMKYGEGHPDGVFLVRESNSHPGTFVITYKYKGKAHHVPIVPAIDEDTDQLVYTLDKGGTRFYDLLQLVEFYQLNSGCLNTKLKRYVVQQKRLDEIEAAKAASKTHEDIVAEGSSSPESDPYTTSALSTLNSSRRSL